MKSADAIYSEAPAASMLTKIRNICSHFAGVNETVSIGHPMFQVDGKTFAVFEQWKGEFGLAMRVEKNLQHVFLKDPRYYLTPYIGKQGWVTFRMETKPLRWKEIREMLRGSYLIVADRRGL
jgi:predicted DNA-binding protein (MmcQ/YjbR family)